MTNYCPVAGVGAISAAGKSAQAGYINILSGKSFLSPLSLFEWSRETPPLVGEVQGFQKERNFSRTEALAIAAISEAIDGFNLSKLRVGLTVATTVGGVDQTEEEYYSKDDENSSMESGRYKRHEAGALSGFLAKHFNVDGFHTVSTACSSGIHAIGMARRLLEMDEYDAVISVGTDALLKLTLNGFDSLLLVDPAGPHPFDKDRLGIALGEAAGAVLLISEEVCKERDITPVGYISGWGASADAYHMTAPEPNGEGANTAVTDALADAEIDNEEVDWIITHGTSTIDNDLAEVKALKRIFKNTVPPFTSFKGSIGHTLAASGSVEVVYAIEAMKNSQIPPTLGFKTIDPELGLAPARAQKCKIKTVLKIALGFGGNNGALVISGEKK